MTSKLLLAVLRLGSANGRHDRRLEDGRKGEAKCVPSSLPCAAFLAGAPLSHGSSSLLLVTPFYQGPNRKQMTHLKRMIWGEFVHKSIISKDAGVEDPRGRRLSTPGPSGKESQGESVHVVRSRHLQAREAAGWRELKEPGKWNPWHGFPPSTGFLSPGNYWYHSGSVTLCEGGGGVLLEGV